MNQSQPSQPAQGGALKWLLIVLVIIILLGGGYLVWAKYGGTSTGTATPTASPSVAISPSASSNTPADWKTYTNDTYKFSFKYPNGYSIEESDNASGKTITISNIDEFAILIEIEKANAAHDTSTGRIDQYSVGDFTVYNLARESGSSELDRKITVINKNNQTFVIHSTIPRSTPAVIADWKSKFDQILSTFQFTQ